MADTLDHADICYIATLFSGDTVRFLALNKESHECPGFDQEFMHYARTQMFLSSFMTDVPDGTENWMDAMASTIERRMPELEKYHPGMTFETAIHTANPNFRMALEHLGGWYVAVCIPGVIPDSETYDRMRIGATLQTLQGQYLASEYSNMLAPVPESEEEEEEFTVE